MYFFSNHQSYIFKRVAFAFLAMCGESSAAEKSTSALKHNQETKGIRELLCWMQARLTYPSVKMYILSPKVFFYFCKCLVCAYSNLLIAVGTRNGNLSTIVIVDLK